MINLVCLIWGHFWANRYPSNLPSVGNVFEGFRNVPGGKVTRVCMRCEKNE